MKLFKCTVCGYVHQGDSAPDICPKCGSLKEKFVELDAEAADKILKSDRTNDIHMELINLGMRMSALCDEGMQINLDPKCFSCFEKAKAEVKVIKQRSKAELAGHMNYGKW